MLKDALSIPTAASQINGPGLREADTMTESTALKLPNIRSIGLKHKQGAG